MSQIPELGPRGEGWLLLQIFFMVSIPLAAWQASPPLDETPEVRLVRQVGYGILLAGLLLLFASSAALRNSRSFSALPRPIDSGSLVVAGPYRFVRHPIYCGLILAGIGSALIRESLLVGVLTLVLSVVLDLKRRREEAWLLKRYPDYAAYRARTKALIPAVY